MPRCPSWVLFSCKKKKANGAELIQPASADPGSSDDVGTQPVHITSPEQGIPCTNLLVEVQGDMGGKFCVPNDIDRPAIRHVKAGKLWEAETHEFMDKELKASSSPGDVVTMGLFFGDFVPHLSRLVGPNQRVWGLEPNPLNYALARGTVASNGLKNVWIANAGVGNGTVGALDFCVIKDGASNGGFSHAGTELGCTLARIPVVALDDILPRERRINLIHADVQGEELNAIKGAVETIKKWKPLVLLEQQNDLDTRKSLSWDIKRAQQEMEEQQKFMEALGYQEGPKFDSFNTVYRYVGSA